VLAQRSDRLVGILNGVDYSAWDPARDPFIHTRYSSDDMAGKDACKRDLLEAFGLPVSGPVIGIVSRLADQKGFDLITEVLPDLVRDGATVVILGKGDGDEGLRIENELVALAKSLPRLGLAIARDNTLAHRIEAGADMFLMPSRTEPCGLNQMYSMRYGTVPIVHATGGLHDTIEPYEPLTGRGTGFRFADYTGAALLACVRRALQVYRTNRRAWRRLQVNGMGVDYSWPASAREYVAVYQRAISSAMPAAPGGAGDDAAGQAGDATGEAGDATGDDRPARMGGAAAL
jgi:starch synthase